MLRFVFFSAIVLQAAAAVAGDRESFLKKVEVGRERMMEVRTEAELYRLCGVDRIAACTRFAAYQLSATCSASKSAWSITASARFTPYMFLFRRSAMLHERLHVFDVQNSAAEFLRQLEETHFETRDLCETTAARSVAEFPQQMEHFVRASDEKRHCSELRK